MHVIAPARYQSQPTRRSKRRLWLIPTALLLAVGAFNYLRPLPAPVATLSISTPAGTTTPVISWPGSGQAAVAASGYGLLGTDGNIKPLATASIAKVIAALCVLQKQPLNLSQSGPTYTVGASDVDIYQTYAAENGSLIPVTAGEQLTEYQALEALMIPSANNIADSLVRWVFGSHQAYAAYASTFLEQHGMHDTHIGSDASGFDPSTTSTASDLTNLGLLALKNPVLMQIAGKSSTTLPVVGAVSNYDTILGVHGITGLKTGNNDDDPGAFLFTATTQVGGQDILLTGSVMGAADLNTALQNSTQLVASMQQGFEQVSVAQTGKVIGTMHAVWGASTPITARQSVGLVRWKATPLTETHHIDTSIRSGTVGSLKLAAGQAQSQSSLQLSHPLAGPSFWWRLTRH